MHRLLCPTQQQPPTNSCIYASGERLPLSAARHEHWHEAPSDSDPLSHITQKYAAQRAQKSSVMSTVTYIIELLLPAATTRGLSFAMEH